MWNSLPGPQGLGVAVHDVEPGHGLVADLGVEPDHVGVLELVDEGQGVADGRQQDVAARLVGLGLDGEAHRVAAVEHVGAQSVDGLLHAVEGGPHVLGGVGLRPLPAPPGDVGLRPELGRQVDVAQGLAQGDSAGRCGRWR